MAPRIPPSYDPNFPPDLNIAPLLPQAFESAAACGPGGEDEWDQTVGIERYGIAGRVWDASYPLLPYLTEPGPSSRYDFEPECSLFASSSSPSIKGKERERDFTILELGSGQSLASLHLAAQLPPTSQIILTDLPEVVSLCEKNANDKLAHLAPDQKAQVHVRGLAWGDEASGEEIARLVHERRLSHVLLCDLIYFPHLYPLLLKTLLQVTSPPFCALNEPQEGETFGPELIISYKSRTLALEESFFQAFGLYFKVEPVLSRLARSEGSKEEKESQWRLHGEEHDTHLYVARRWKVEDGWTIPSVERIMSPESAKGVKKGEGGWGLIEGMFGGLEWD